MCKCDVGIHGDDELVVRDEGAEGVREDPGIMVVGDGRGLVVFVVVAVDEGVEVVVYDGVGDESAAGHGHVLEVEDIRVEDLVIAIGDARVDVDNKHLFAQWLGPDGLVGEEGLAVWIDVFGVLGVVFY
jgi:hypothetical protein